MHPFRFALNEAAARDFNLLPPSILFVPLWRARNYGDNERAERMCRPLLCFAPPPRLLCAALSEDSKRWSWRARVDVRRRGDASVFVYRDSFPAPRWGDAPRRTRLLGMDDGRSKVGAAARDLANDSAVSTATPAVVAHLCRRENFSVRAFFLFFYLLLPPNDFSFSFNLTFVGLYSKIHLCNCTFLSSYLVWRRVVSKE